MSGAVKCPSLSGGSGGGGRTGDAVSVLPCTVLLG